MQVSTEVLTQNCIYPIKKFPQCCYLFAAILFRIAAPSVALLFLSPLFSFQGASEGYTLKIEQCRNLSFDLPKRSDLECVLLAAAQALLRKEVIQPLVLERLPCYDFTPITKPTFGRALPCGLDYGLRVFPALMV